jgi:hypothetical protein
MLVAGVVVLSTLGTAGCTTIASLRSSYAIADCDGAILSTRYIPAGLRFRDHIRYQAGDTSVGYEVVMEVLDDDLSAVVFTTFGNKAVSLRQRRDSVDVINHMGPALAVSPMNLLRDLHRVHFLRLALVGGDASEDRLRIDGFTVTEQLTAAGIIRRISGPRAGDRATVTIASGRATVEREGCGYRARVVSVGSGESAPPSR